VNSVGLLAEADDPAAADGFDDEGGVADGGSPADGGFDGRLGSLGDAERFMSLAARIVNVLAFVSTRTSCPIAICLAAAVGGAVVDGGCEVAGGCDDGGCDVDGGWADGVDDGCCDGVGC